MKIRIEGCTAEELFEHSPYLKLNHNYEATVTGLEAYRIFDDEGDTLDVLGPHYGGCAFLPEGAKWAEVTCCKPSAEDMKLIANGDYCAEELWGGPRPTCPECIDK